MKDRKIERVTHYEYDEKGELTSMTVNETITNPDCEDCGLVDEGELMTGELEVDTEHSFADIAFGLAALGLCATAMVAILKRT